MEIKKMKAARQTIRHDKSYCQCKPYIMENLLERVWPNKHPDTATLASYHRRVDPPPCICPCPPPSLCQARHQSSFSRFNMCGDDSPAPFSCPCWHIMGCGQDSLNPWHDMCHPNPRCVGFQPR